MMNIYVGNLPYNSSDVEIKQLFEKFGVVCKVSLISDRETGRSRGFGFVEMPNDEEGHKAIEALNGQEYGGRFLTVNEARPRSSAAGNSAPATRPQSNRNYTANRDSPGYTNRNQN